LIISPPRQTFRQFRTAATVAAWIAAIVGGVIVIAAFEKQMRPTVPALIGAVLIAVTLAFGRTVITIHDEGIRRKTIFGSRELEWHQVREYRFVVMMTPAKQRGGTIVEFDPDAGGTSGRSFFLTLIGQDGTKIPLTSALKGAATAVHTIVETLHNRMRPKVESEVRSSGAQFGPLRVSWHELQWKRRDPVPIRELSKVEIAGMKLRVRKKGKMLSVISVRSDKVPNVLLFVEIMRKLGIDTEVAPFGRSLIRSETEQAI
jgi:uncharacterized protein DUF6585